MDDPTWLEKARGYLDLGMLEEAWNELDSVSEDVAFRAQVLEMRVVIQLEQKDFEKAFHISKELAEWDPENHAGFIQGAYSLHAAGSTQEAIDFLQTGPESLRGEQCYFYNLACYEVALGRVDAALTWLNQSITLDPQNRLRALKDGDLSLLHDKIPSEDS